MFYPNAEVYYTVANVWPSDRFYRSGWAWQEKLVKRCMFCDWYCSEQLQKKKRNFSICM